jgi:hypothetical protein
MEPHTPYLGICSIFLEEARLLRVIDISEAFQGICVQPCLHLVFEILLIKLISMLMRLNYHPKHTTLYAVFCFIGVVDRR